MAQWGEKWTAPVAPVVTKPVETPYRATCGDHVYYFRALTMYDARRKADNWFWQRFGRRADGVQEQD